MDKLCKKQGLGGDGEGADAEQLPSHDCGQKAKFSFRKVLVLRYKILNQHRCKPAPRFFPCWSIFVLPAKACVATFGMQVL